MMNTKTAITTVLFLGSSVVFSGTMGPVCEQGIVSVPCENSMWDIGVQALYLKSVNDANRAYLYNSVPAIQIVQPAGFDPVAPITFPNNFYQNLDNDWDWGYRIEGSYHFKTGNDVTVNWTHFDSNDYYPLSGQASQTVFVGGFAFGNETFNLQKFTNSNKFNQVNLVMGQHVDFGVFKNIRFYGGLQYAKIKVNSSLFLDAAVQIGGITTTATSEVFDNTEYNGLGPVIGTDYSYDFGSNFSLTANGQMSILYGNKKQNFGNKVTTSSNANFVAGQTRSSKSTNAIVPSLEGKVGVNYAYKMGHGVLNLQAGFQILDYFSAVNGYNQNVNAPSDGDYGLYGPYFGAKWVGQA